MDVKVGMGKKAKKVSQVPVRQCANVKSKTHPDVRCSCPATQGDFCARHVKNPKRFQETHTLNADLSIKKTNSVKCIQTAWRLYRPLLRFKRQGPGVHDSTLAENETDVCTLDEISKIPLLYRWSYADSKKHIWLFDIRSLSMYRSESSTTHILNPYTRDPLSEKARESFTKRCTQLRNHKYCLVHTNDETLSEDQIWHQNLLDVSIKYDMLGYHMSLNWFNDLTSQELYVFYYELWELWMYRLQLPIQIKNSVVSHWNKNETRLFKWLPLEIRHKRDRVWWRKQILEILKRLVGSTIKEHRTLGALYGMTGFAIVSPVVRQFYPWLVEMPEVL